MELTRERVEEIQEEFGDWTDIPDLCRGWLAMSAENERLKEGKRLKMYVWSQKPEYLAVALASSVEEARARIMQEVGESGDGSCPVRDRARGRILSETPTIWFFSNAEFALTDSAEVEEQEDLNCKLQADNARLAAQVSEMQPLLGKERDEIARLTREFEHAAAQIERSRQFIAEDQSQRIKVGEEQSAEIERLERELAEETKIVDRIWDLFGRPSYEDLNGRTIYDLITDLHRELAEERKRLAEVIKRYKTWKDHLRDMQQYNTRNDRGQLGPMCPPPTAERHELDLAIENAIAALEIRGSVGAIRRQDA